MCSKTRIEIERRSGLISVGLEYWVFLAFSVHIEAGSLVEGANAHLLAHYIEPLLRCMALNKIKKHTTALKMATFDLMLGFRCSIRCVVVKCRAYEDYKK